jgi:hypothetical protein
MAQGRQADDPAEDGDFPEGDWTEEAGDEWNGEERARSVPVPRTGRKWKAIEDYWERKRLREALQDYPMEDE